MNAEEERVEVEKQWDALGKALRHAVNTGQQFLIWPGLDAKTADRLRMLGYRIRTANDEIFW